MKRLVPNPRNPRTHLDAQVAQIAGSILAFGFNAPILVDSKGGIIAGHGRYLASIKLGLETVPIIVLDHLSETEKRAYLLADNKLAELSSFDDDLLRAELAELRDADIDLGEDQLRWQRLPSFQNLAVMLIKHLDGILNYCRTKVRFAIVEALNGNIRMLINCGRGYGSGFSGYLWNASGKGIDERRSRHWIVSLCGRLDPSGHHQGCLANQECHALTAILP